MALKHLLERNASGGKRESEDSAFCGKQRKDLVERAGGNTRLLLGLHYGLAFLQQSVLLSFAFCLSEKSDVDGRRGPVPRQGMAKTGQEKKKAVGMQVRLIRENKEGES